MNKLTMTGLLFLCIFITGCSGSSEDGSSQERSVSRISEDSMLAPDSMSAPDIELGGQFEISASAPFTYASEEANLRCQDEFPGEPFHAIWTVSGSSIGIKVSGFHDSSSEPMRKVSAFQITTVEDNSQKNARLSGATLSTVEIGKSGATTYYEVEASGTFEEGGTFTASGKCKA